MPAAIAKKEFAAGRRVRLETFAEGLSAQVMHVGPYADESATIALLHRFIDQHGYHPVGRHPQRTGAAAHDPARTDRTVESHGSTAANSRSAALST
jgi:hypothetical protein